MLRSLRNLDETQDVRLYISSHDGKILKSLAVTLRDEDGEPYGLLGLNHDITEVVQAQRTLANFTAVGRLGERSGARSRVRSSPATSATWSPAWSPRSSARWARRRRP